MKKIYISLLIGVSIFDLAACSNQKPKHLTNNQKLATVKQFAKKDHVFVKGVRYNSKKSPNHLYLITNKFGNQNEKGWSKNIGTKKDQYQQLYFNHMTNVLYKQKKQINQKNHTKNTIKLWYKSK